MFKRFASDPDLHLIVECQWDTLNKLRNEEEIDGIATYKGQKWDCELRLRGKFRLMNCDTLIRPFRLQFKRSELRDADLEEFRNHKIVTQCLLNEKGMENLLEEKLVYELYNIITDSSFRVTQGIMTRKWPDAERESDEMAFLVLEPNDELADRLDGTEIERFYYPTDSISALSYNTNALFQFMVGNFDWDIDLAKNVKIIQQGHKALIVPYDFDFCEIVSPDYRRVPLPYMAIYSRYERIYLGKYFQDQLEEVIEHFLAREDAVLNHIDEFEELDKSRRRRIQKYVEDFFDIIDSRNGVDLSEYTPDNL